MSRHRISKQDARRYETQRSGAGRDNLSVPSRLQIEGRGIPLEEYDNGTIFGDDVCEISPEAAAPQTRPERFYRDLAFLVGQRVEGILDYLREEEERRAGYLYIGGDISEAIYLREDDLVPEPNLLFTEERSKRSKLVQGAVYQFEVQDQGERHLRACEAVCVDRFDPDVMLDYDNNHYYAKVIICKESYSFLETPDGVRIFIHQSLADRKLHMGDVVECKLRYVGREKKTNNRYEVSEVISIQSEHSYAPQELPSSIFLEIPDPLQGEAHFILDKNSGFIYPADGSDRIFFNRGAVRPRGELPGGSEPVAYSASGLTFTDKGWRVNKVLIIRRFS